MRRGLVLKVVLGIGLGVFLVMAMIERDSEQENFCVDLANPVAIVAPCEIDFVGEEGERGLRIGEKVGRGWLGEAGGEATYNFYISQEGTYYIWAYALWSNDCSNAIYASVNNREKRVLGNDPVYQEWHWTRGFPVTLHKGTNTLTLSNHSDHIALQKIFFAKGKMVKPDEAKYVFSDIFYDGFDGCDRGNFDQWEQIHGNWSVSNPFDKANGGKNDEGDQPQAADDGKNVLVGRTQSEQEALILMRSKETWSNYITHLSVWPLKQEDPDSCIGICFGVKSQDDYYVLQWVARGKEAMADISLVRTIDNANHVLATESISWVRDRWYDVCIGLLDQHIKVQINDESVIEVSITNEISGGIGLYLKGKSAAYFDDIHVQDVSL